MVLFRRLAVVLAVTVGGLALPDVSHADENVYVVEPGDTLIGIARESGVRLGDVLRANDLRITSLIVPGQRLDLPTGASTPTSSGASTPAPAGGASAGTHTVRWGDTLSGIARRHGVSLSALLRANDMRVTSLIMPGMRLRLPAGATATTGTTTPAPGAAPGAAPAPSAGSHVVKWGDTLSGIAARYGVSLSALLRANDMRVTSLIMPGMRLALPAGAATPPAASVGGSGGSPASPPPSAPPSPTETGVARVVSYALAQQGKPYRFFTKGPDTFDCSGLTLAAYSQIGIKLVHYSAYQAKQGTAVDFHDEPIRPGDLIFQKRRGSNTINHVGMAVTSTTWIQAVGGSTPVTVGPMPHPSSIDTVRRYVDG